MSDMSSILIDAHTGLVSFGFPKTGPVQLKGIFALVQRAVYAILRSIGMDAFRPDWGTNFLKLPGSATISDMPALRADIAIIIKAAEQKILSEESQYNDLSADVRLAAMTLRSVTQDDTDPTVLNINIRLTNKSGQVYNFGIPSIRA